MGTVGMEIDPIPITIPLPLSINPFVMGTATTSTRASTRRAQKRRSRRGVTTHAFTNAMERHVVDRDRLVGVWVEDSRGDKRHFVIHPDNFEYEGGEQDWNQLKRLVFRAIRLDSVPRIMGHLNSER